LANKQAESRNIAKEVVEKLKRKPKGAFGLFIAISEAIRWQCYGMTPCLLKNEPVSYFYRQV